jgi:hypothetical protein
VESPLESLVELSSLTKIQAETLQLHVAMQKSEINMQNVLKKRKTTGISRGTHYRILSQARKNIKQSLLTIAIAAQMDLVKPDDIQKLMASISMIPADVDPEKLPEVLALVSVLVDRIVMF